MKKKVIVAGHICLDITPKFPEVKVRSVEELFQPGKLIHMDGVSVNVGGSVANTGISMKILGADVSLMGKVGDDAFGQLIRRDLDHYGLGSGLIVSEGVSTSYSVVLAIPGIDRIFLHDPGANDRFHAEDIPGKSLEEADLFHFGYPPLMKSMYVDGGEELVSLMQKARMAGAATSLDLAAVDSASEAGQADWAGILKKTLPFVDFFVPSAEELCYMVDRPRFDRWKILAGSRDITEAVDLGNEVPALAEQCLRWGAGVVLIKCGSAGMYFRSGDRERLSTISSRIGVNVDAWADREIFEESYVPDKIVSATGAGDTSIAAFLTAMLDGHPLEETLHLAAATGASCLTTYDAFSGLQSFEELEEKIQRGWPKQAGYRTGD